MQFVDNVPTSVAIDVASDLFQVCRMRGISKKFYQNKISGTA